MASEDDEHTQRISDALLHLTRRCTGLHVACVGEDFDELLGVEAEIATELNEFKRAEFARGRTAARRVLAQAGMAPLAIGSSEAGPPLFSDEIVGSISHKHQMGRRGRSSPLCVPIHRRREASAASMIRYRSFVAPRDTPVLT